MLGQLCEIHCRQVDGTSGGQFSRNAGCVLGNPSLEDLSSEIRPNGFDGAGKPLTEPRDHPNQDRQKPGRRWRQFTGPERDHFQVRAMLDKV
jgi:hypothetical protein